MTNNVSVNFKETAYAQETDVAVITLLTMTIGTTVIRVCNTPIERFADLGENTCGVTSNGERYIFLPFDI